MGKVRLAGCWVGVALLLALVGCGSSGSGTTGSTGAGTTTVERAVESAVQSRGTKGENPATEAATKAHLSAADCKALGALAERQTQMKLARHPTPAPPLSHCRLDAHGVSVNVFLDSGFAAAQRYHNRIEETVQFGSEDPSKVPHPVPHVGDKAAYNADAGWIPALRSLLAVRGNRWLTVTISIAGRSNRELRAQAAVLARAGFKLTASG